MNDETLLLRQVHPSWVQGGVISNQTFSSQTFTPMSKDKGLLSIFNGEKFSALSAYEHYTQSLQLVSVGVVAVTLGECKTIPINVLEDNEPFDGHCSIDFRLLTGSAIKRTATTLKDYAKVRDWLYKAESK